MEAYIFTAPTNRLQFIKGVRKAVNSKHPFIVDIRDDPKKPYPMGLKLTQIGFFYHWARELSERLKEDKFILGTVGRNVIDQILNTRDDVVRQQPIVFLFWTKNYQQHHAFSAYLEECKYSVKFIKRFHYYPGDDRRSLDKGGKERDKMSKFKYM